MSKEQSKSKSDVEAAMKKAGKKKESSKDAKDEKIIKINELTDSLQMLQADFENFRKRGEKERAEFREYAKIGTIERFLPILDNFELALKHVTKSDDFTDGIKLIFSQMMSVLEIMRVDRIEALGKSFDPHLHEALMADYSDDPKDTVIEEFQAGYILNSDLGARIIRHSKVKISKGPKGEACKEERSKEECKKEGERK